MKAFFCFILMILIAGTGVVFARDFNPMLYEFARSILPGDAKVISIFPPTQEAADILLDIRLGRYQPMAERIIGPSMHRIAPGTKQAHWAQGIVALAMAANTYAEGEAYSITMCEETASEIATIIETTLVFIDTIRNARELLRLTITFQTSDGATGHAEAFWITAETASLDVLIRETAAEISSGNFRETTTTEQRTANVRWNSPQTSSSDTVKNVRELMDSSELIQSFRENNRRRFRANE